MARRASSPRNWISPKLLLRVVQRWLGGGAQQQGDAAMLGQQAQGVEQGLADGDGQQLGFVQHNHAVHQAMQFAAAAGAGGVNSDSNSRTLVVTITLASQFLAASRLCTVSCSTSRLLWVLQHGVVTQGRAKHQRFV